LVGEEAGDGGGLDFQVEVGEEAGEEAGDGLEVEEEVGVVVLDLEVVGAGGSFKGF
jgi:hypothetical protein